MREPARALLLTALLLACGGGERDGSDAQAAGAAPQASAEREAEPHDHKAHARPLPAFEGWSLDNRRIVISEFLGRRLLLYFFNPEARDAVSATAAVLSVAALSDDHNFRIVGIATGSDRATALEYVAAQGIDFPVIDDSDARLARQFGLRSPITLVGVDAEGFLAFGVPGVDGADQTWIERTLRKALRLPGTGQAQTSRPLAPQFSGDVLDSDRRFDLAEHAGEPVIVIFFLHTCPHCHHALEYLKGVLAELPEAQRPTLVGIEITGRSYAVRSALEEAGLDYFPVLFDEAGDIQESYGVFGGVPDIFFVDREGRIDARLQGWSAQTHEALTRMRAARIAGAPVPMMLNTNGYTGNEVCGVCHARELDTWRFTSHAGAFDTLVKHGADGDAECVGCHVVGHGEPGGFVDAVDTPAFEDVGCESCHGRGGPHLSPDHVKDGDYEAVCVTCHNPTHSLGFEYATFLPRVSHAANAALLELPAEEQARILAERGRPGDSLLPTKAAHVGSEACRSCHASEFETWHASPHAKSLATLIEKGSAGDPDCLRCHTTAFGRDDGFPKTGTAESHPDLGRVGCESCHGPGGDHVADGAAKRGTILSLGDKCDSCVILKICGSCHDDVNDPGFQFEVQEKIDRQRHGTIEAGTGRPKDASAKLAPGPELLAAHARALAGGREPAWPGR